MRQTDPFTCGTPELHEKVGTLLDEMDTYLRKQIAHAFLIDYKDLRRWRDTVTRQQLLIQQLQERLQNVQTQSTGTES